MAGKEGTAGGLEVDEVDGGYEEVVGEGRAAGWGSGGQVAGEEGGEVGQGEAERAVAVVGG